MAALQNFIDNSLPTIKAAWLNSVDAFVNTLFAGATTAAQAREALNIASQPTYRNRVFNGRWQLGQFNNTVTTSGYIIDQWLAASGSTGTYTMTRVGAVGLADHPYFGRVSSGAANTVGAASYWGLETRIEGFTVDDLNWGTPDAATMTLSFWARVSIPGIYSVALRNLPTITHSFVNTFEAIDTGWHRYVIQVPGPTVGTWVIANSGSISLTFMASCGTTYQTGVLATWGTGNFIASTTQTQSMATSGFTFDITGVQFERGVIATPFEFVPHQVELNRLQRYYEPISVHVGTNSPAGGNLELTTIGERAIKRSTPSITVITTLGIVNVVSASWGYQNLGPPLLAITPGTGGWYYQVVVAVDARL